ncbi:hypothetical protein V6N12_045592 [Hibiscus sabdariffa]|uniref:Uncharacterized protein n=1 Tax=Hibiscus sabdariffa TaxID=183260 RepID=A0ABR2G360_9ROSI
MYCRFRSFHKLQLAAHPNLIWEVTELAANNATRMRRSRAHPYDGTLSDIKWKRPQERWTEANTDGAC